MLHDYDRGRSVTKFTHQFQRCVCVVVIIVGEFLALDLLGLRDAVGRGTKRQIKRSVLVWIFTIAQRGGKLAADRQQIGRASGREGVGEYVEISVGAWQVKNRE